MIHATIYGGTSVIGWYFVYKFDCWQAVRHSVYLGTDNRLIDIVPYTDLRPYNMFGRSASQDKDYTHSNLYSSSCTKYNMQETKLTSYYVYQLVDPRTNIPFYIGKGSGRRAKTHLWDIPETRNQYKENKIASIRRSGLEPLIEYVAENILDEQLAYEIEASLIKKYGRKGYDSNGILTNICIDSRPPNHKGKSYEEIYGDERANIERQKRADIQKARGGYGPRYHSQETKDKIRESCKGKGMHGKKHTEYSKKLLSEKATRRLSQNNTLRHHYSLTSPDGHKYDLCGKELAVFCKDHNLSFSTLKKQTEKGSSPPKYGKTKGWVLKDLGRNN